MSSRRSPSGAWHSVTLLSTGHMYFPNLSLPLNKYHYWIASYVNHGVPTVQWLEYDRQLRMAAAAQSWDATFRTHQDPITFAECIEKPRQHASAASKAFGTCRNCGEQGHHIASCPHVIKPKAGRPAPPQQNRATFDISKEICRKFNEGACNGPQCRNGRIHKCPSCGDTHHGIYSNICNPQ